MSHLAKVGGVAGGWLSGGVVGGGWRVPPGGAGCFPSPWVVWWALASGPRPLRPWGRVRPSFLAGSLRAGLVLVRLVGPGGFGVWWGGLCLAEWDLLDPMGFGGHGLSAKQPQMASGHLVQSCFVACLL